MSIQIYEDSENGLPREFNNKKNKREDCRTQRLNVPKPSKRVALGTITNTLVGSRVQPSRAAKDKHKTVPVFAKKTQKPEVYKSNKNGSRRQSCCSEALSTSLTAESPMIFSPILHSESFEEIKTDELSLQIDDITNKLDEIFGCREYAQDIHNYMKKSESKYRAKQHYMKKQTDINNSMRAILIDWLVEVAEEYKLHPQTLYLTVNYIDRFLSCMSVLRGKLQLVGAACMLIAAKFEEIYPPEVAEFVYITEDTYTSKQVLRMEHLILKTLSFDISVPTCDSFINRYLLAAGSTKDNQLQFLVQYLCELTLIDCDITLKYLPSMITASAIYISNVTLNVQPWTPTLEFYTGFQVEDLLYCVRDMHQLHSNASQQAQQAIQQKYKTSKFGSVSTLHPIPTLPL